MSNAIDTPVNAVSEKTDQTLIIATMTWDTYDGIAKDFMIGMTVVPGSYSNYIRTLEDRYAIKRVADWPLESLGERCLVFESKGLLNREDIVRLLREDPRIETAQPLRVFQILGEGYNDMPRFVWHWGLFLSVHALYRILQTKNNGVA